MSTIKKLFVTLSALLIGCRANDDTLCVWGSSIQPKVNGVYHYITVDENFNRYWAKTNDYQYFVTNGMPFDANNNCTDPVYIKRGKFTGWYIQSDTTTYSSAGLLNSNVYESTNWNTYNGSNWISEPNLDVFIITSDSECPEWNCTGIQVISSSNPSCNGVFYQVDQVSNVYKKQGDDYWIYFASFEGFWVCNDRLEPDLCLKNYLAVSDPTWGILQPGQSIDNTGTLGNIACLGTYIFSFSYTYPYTYHQNWFIIQYK